VIGCARIVRFRVRKQHVSKRRHDRSQTVKSQFVWANCFRKQWRCLHCSDESVRLGRLQAAMKWWTARHVSHSICESWSMKSWMTECGVCVLGSVICISCSQTNESCPDPWRRGLDSRAASSRSHRTIRVPTCLTPAQWIGLIQLKYYLEIIPRSLITASIGGQVWYSWPLTLRCLISVTSTLADTL